MYKASYLTKCMHLFFGKNKSYLPNKKLGLEDLLDTPPNSIDVVLGYNVIIQIPSIIPSFQLPTYAIDFTNTAGCLRLGLDPNF